ncbi:uncharacterized protein FMAN_15498 [Fusarium mangiferae]|uniref:Reverse transcriptase domain-containing protein n=1 Tax=Fusarium mangiferae TaxID=192010 RepID=A0A1L7UF88_FUSMA|nr:uncharacterized protein FMAN_15498 [Fusarium mangiferae]CVL09334.1 uncharacterized protein FMAN_15498 [Fusarium mangiferae]
MPLTEATVEYHLATSSDHFTLSLTLPDARPAPLQPGRIRVTTEDEVKRFVEIVEFGASEVPHADSATLRAIRRIYPRGFNQDVQMARRCLYRVMGKTNALRRATLERRTLYDDIVDPWTPVSPPRSILFSTEVSLDEAQYATIHTGNTSAGVNINSITVNLLKAAWHILGTCIRRLFERCLSTGHQPKPFKEAEVVMIAKPGRRDLTEPRTWRTISLLSCLGKGLERLIVRRLAWAAVHCSLLHSQQAGALPKRSATDLVAALIRDIEEAFARNRVATLVTMDIQGAFDTVMRNRLVLRLRERGWPGHLARWVESFMQDRSARVRYQDTLTTFAPLHCGLPQGSPVSSILFLLYNEPIYRLGNPQGRFGYADDTAILSIGDTIDETIAMASSSIDEMVRWV